MVQYQYGAGIVIGPICRDDFGAILSRIKVAESEREKIRGILQRVLSVSADHASVRGLLHDELRSLAEEATGEKDHIRL